MEDVWFIKKEFAQGETKNVNNLPYVVETIPTMGGKGTDQTIVRPKTFYENLGITENSAAKNLKSTYESIQDDYKNNKITEQEAQTKTNQAFKKYVTAQTIIDIPKNLAIGAGLVALNIVAPPVGAVVDAYFIGSTALT
jgi:hypothetical protein